MTKEILVLSPPLLRTGAMRFHDAPEPVLHFERSEGDAVLHAVFNLSPEPQVLPLPAPLSAVGGHPCEGRRYAFGSRPCTEQ